MKRVVLFGQATLTSFNVWAEGDSLSDALNNGADAKIVTRVLDQNGCPVSNTCVKCGVWHSHTNGGPVEVVMRTDGNGMCTVINEKTATIGGCSSMLISDLL